MTTIKKKNFYFMNLCKNLEQMGLSYDEVKKNYRYSGGRGNDDTNSEHEFASETRHSRYFNQCFPNGERPQHVEICLCEHPIVENCYISKNFEIDTILILGNCCIKTFIDASSRTCEICYASHKNRKTNYCNECKIIYKKCKHCNKNINGKAEYCNYECFSEKNYKKCIKCKSLFRVLNNFNKCDTCCKGSCFTCNKKIDPTYKNCYTCNLIKK